MNRRARTHEPSAFTLVELLVSMLVLSIMVVLLTQMVGALRGAITRTTSQIGEFQEARAAFETMTRRIGQATLNAYDDLNPSAATGYARASELRFVSGNEQTLTNNANASTDAVFFQAPLGFSNQAVNAPMARLLNTCGYYIQFGSDAALRPGFLPPSFPQRWRFRLMELIEPTESLSIYNHTSGTDNATPPKSLSWSYSTYEWFQDAFNETPVPTHVLAENVIFLALLPMVAPQNVPSSQTVAPDGTSTILTTDYSYDTAPGAANMVAAAHNQLPPLVCVMMIAVDEKSYARYQASQGSSYPASLTMLQNQVLTKADYGSRKNDIDSVTKALNDNKVTYRIFTTTVPLTSH